MVCSQPGRFCALKLATVVGSSRIDDAKIGGITPETLSFSGRCEDFAAIDLVADLALGIVHEQAALRPLHEDDEARPAPPRTPRSKMISKAD